MTETTSRDWADAGRSWWRHLIGFGALVAMAAMIAAMGYNAFATSKERREAEAWQLHTMNVLVVTSQLRSAVNGALRGERGYLLTSDPTFLAPYEQGRIAAPKHAQDLRRLMRDNPAQMRTLARLEPQLEEYLTVIARVVALQRDGRGEEAVAIVRSGLGRYEIERVLAALDRIETAERALLATRAAAHESATRRSDRYYSVLTGMGVVLLLLVSLTALSASRAHRRGVAASRELKRLATTDALTGIANRRHFTAMLDTEVERAQRSGQPLSLALIDIDHFKAINDTHGHPGGDEVLRAIGALLAETTRIADVPARIGGEEFAVLMPETNTEQARLACERIREAIAARPVSLPTGERVEVTLSAGVALLVADEEADKLMTRADAALYDAKQGGRNRVELAA